MSVELIGPWSFDLQGALRSARNMLSVQADDGQADSTQKVIGPSDASEPGAYLIVIDDMLAGFWIVFSKRYLDDGTLSSSTPPYAAPFLEALTEEIWWNRLNVTPREGNRWWPLIVFEWLPDLANRSAFPPPGVPPERVEGADLEEEAGDWLVPGIHVKEEDERVVRVEEEWLELEPKRSTLCIIRGDVKFVRSRHEGVYEVLEVPPLPNPPPEGEPFEEWLIRAASSPNEPSDHARFSSPVSLPGGRVGFPMNVWYDRDLNYYPKQPNEAVIGELTPRDVRNRLWAQLGLAVSLTIGVLVGVLGMNWTMYEATRPPTGATVQAAKAASGPSLSSVCSVDHEGFIEELRCQSKLLGRGKELAHRACAVERRGGERRHEDLVPTYCGLRARDPKLVEAAAAQACYLVLGKPEEYKERETGYADPDRFLRYRDSRLAALGSLVTNLDVACGVYDNWVERRVQGAVLSAHVGGDSPEAVALQDMVFKEAEGRIEDPTEQLCFEAGRADQEVHPATLDGMCPTDRRGENADDERAIARKVLGPSPDMVSADAMSKYLSARFPFIPQGLYDCHDRLRNGLGNERIESPWGLSVRGPVDYSGPRIDSQLKLDSALRAMRDGFANRNELACWGEVDGILAAYNPVHPLLSSISAESWPSSEQQLCGQICAAHYQVDLSAAVSRWSTPQVDMSVCLNSGPLPKPGEIIDVPELITYDDLQEEDTGLEIDPELLASNETKISVMNLDRLQIPWNNNVFGAWVVPTEEQVCGFHMVAQGYLPQVVDGDLPLPFWAGEGDPGIAGGGRDGAAYDAAESLSIHGRSRTRNSCAHVATQCFASEFLSVVEQPDIRRYEWNRAWTAHLAEIRAMSEKELEKRPWCRLIWPFLSSDGTLPEGDLDFPCALGVEQTNVRFQAAIEKLAVPTSEEAP